MTSLENGRDLVARPGLPWESHPREPFNRWHEPSRSAKAHDLPKAVLRQRISPRVTPTRSAGIEPARTPDAGLV